MGGGFVSSAGAGRAAEYKGGLSCYVLFTAIVASSGGLLFGYDLVRCGHRKGMSRGMH